MTILIFAALYHPYTGGYVESIHELAKRLVSKKHQVHVITCNTNQAPLKEIIDGVQIVRIPCWNPHSLNESFPIPKPLSLLKVLMQWKSVPPIDVISTQTRFFPITWVGYTFGKLKKIPVVHTERGSTHSISSSKIIKGLAWFIDHTIGTVIAKWSEQSTGVSESACEFLKHLGATHVEKIYNGINIDFWKKRKEAENNNINKKNSVTITYVGRLIYGKGVQDLIQAVALIKEKTGNKWIIIINVIGEGPYKTSLETYARKLNVDTWIKFLGKKNHEEIRSVLWNSDIFVNPSYSEGLPRSVLEAAAAGVPIIATNVGGTKEIISDEKMLVPPQNPKMLSETISKLLEKKEARQDIKKKLEQRVTQNFIWDDIVIKYERVFEQCSNLKHLQK